MSDLPEVADELPKNDLLRARHYNQLRKQGKLIYASIDPADGSRRMIPEPEAIAEDAIIEATVDESVNVSGDF